MTKLIAANCDCCAHEFLGEELRSVKLAGLKKSLCNDCLQKDDIFENYKSAVASLTAPDPEEAYQEVLDDLLHMSDIEIMETLF